MIKIREALLADAPSIVDFQIAMAKETEGLDLESLILVEGVAKVFLDPSKGKYFVAEKNGKIIGCLLTTFEWSDWRNGIVLWIQSVYVNPDQRGKGIYSQLYAYIKEQVKNDSHMKGIRLYVDKSNTAAQKVYEHLHMDGNHYKVYEWMKD
ncbi:MAG: GNAT family N-acetyltransferase [Flammeovirgaceae bacterium]|nr:GNAT family N-acetyltransferase [Flammeovirgaceae bacterium]